MGEIASALEHVGQDLIELRDLNRRLQRDLGSAKAQAARAAELDDQVVRLERELGVLAKVGHRNEPPRWLTSPAKSKAHRGTPWLLLSDLHLDEVVKPAEVLGVNAFNREIAESRLRTTFETAVKLARDSWSGFTYDGIVCAMGGDIFSGSIHEELTQTNEDTVLGSLDHWIDHVAAGINLLADEFGHVHVPVVVGNHGRNTRKPRAKLRARDNFDWFFGKAVARAFAHDKRVTFDISESPDVIIPSYGHKVMLTHGDQAKGGGGIGGIWPPIMRMDAKKRQRNASVELPYDLMICGHWHQLVFGQGFIVNGSLKGMDEYAFISNFGFEPPAQAFWMMTPEHGRTFTAPIYPQARATEGW